MNAVQEELARRLKDLPLEQPQARVITARVLSEARRPTRVPSRVRPRPAGFRPAALAVVLVAMLPLTRAFLYFSPASSTALADVGGPNGFSNFVLQGVGLGPGSEVTSQSASVGDTSFRIRLVGAYADSIRTVVLVNVYPADANFDAVLRDQFGLSYDMHSGQGDLRTGDYALAFSPASWLTAKAGLRFTLEMHPVPLGFSLEGAPLKLRGVVLVNSGHQLATPESGPVGQGYLTFRSVRYAGRVVAFDAELSGIPNSELNREFPKGSGLAALTIVMTPANGGPAIMASEYGESSNGGPTSLSAYFTDVDPGSYALSIAVYGEGSLERTIVVS